MATFDISPLFRSTAVGFDRAWNQLNTAVHLDSGGAPAYNVLRTGAEEFRISLAVPGYDASELTLETRERVLWVKGERGVDPDHNQYLYRGIDMGGFQRTFQLPEHVKVAGARLEAGMLHVDLVRDLPEALRPRRIEIEAGESDEVLLESTSEAA
jgi:molecular chaperone IbpA